MEQYNKRPLTYKEQIALLKSRGVAFADDQRAERHLANISYYRLSAYMLPYKKRENGIIVDEFKKGTTWDMIHQLYVFDRKLRILVFDAIERLEISLRTQIIYQLSHKYGSHWQDEPSIFHPATVQRSKIYYFFCMLNYLLQTANPTSPFKQRLMELLKEYKHVISMSAMGFPEHWEAERIWNI